MNNQIDRFTILIRLQTLLPMASTETHARVLFQITNESACWQNMSTFEFEARVDVRLEAICRNYRESSLSTIDLRRRGDDWENKPITRADALRFTASAALDFPANLFELDQRGDNIYVNVSHLHSKSKFTVAIIERSWLPDFKRLHRELFLKNDERFYVRTTKEVNHFGKTRLKEVPVISIVAAAKYKDPNFDSVLLTAHTKNENHLDLTFANVIVPAKERTLHTRFQNEKLIARSAIGGSIENLSGYEPIHASPNRPNGAGTDQDPKWEPKLVW